MEYPVLLSHPELSVLFALVRDRSDLLSLWISLISDERTHDESAFILNALAVEIGCPYPLSGDAETPSIDIDSCTDEHLSSLWWELGGSSVAPPTKRDVYRWETIGSYVATFPRGNDPDGACDVSVEIGSSHGLWFIRTVDDTWGPDLAPSGFFRSREEAEAVGLPPDRALR
jgi:hypothetical protein